MLLSLTDDNRSSKSSPLSCFSTGNDLQFIYSMSCIYVILVDEASIVWNYYLAICATCTFAHFVSFNKISTWILLCQTRSEHKICIIHVGNQLNNAMYTTFFRIKMISDCLRLKSYLLQSAMGHLSIKRLSSQYLLTNFKEIYLQVTAISR